MKFGRNWVTKKEWLEEYLQHAEEYNNNLEEKKIALPAETLIKMGKPPENLPAQEPSSFLTFVKEKLKSPVLRLGFVAALVFVLLTAGITFGKDSFKYVYNELDPFVHQLSQDSNYAESFKNVLADVSPLVQEINQKFDKGASAAISNFQFPISNLDENISLSRDALGIAGDIIIEKSVGIVSDGIFSIGQSFENVGYPIVDESEAIFSTFASFGSSVRNAFYNGISQLADFGVTIKKIPQQVSESYFAANDFVEQKLGRLAKGPKLAQIIPLAFLGQEIPET
ncbi:MAG: hypothetical protein Q8N88_00570, partial [Nanoarchaeota archaeon]|nr:hypothetical protein [Nanoarchaeota archaeon]